MSLLHIEQLEIRTHKQAAQALVRVGDLTVKSREIVGIVGESGSGKSLLAKALLGLLPSNLNASGSVQFQQRALDVTTRQTPAAMAVIFQHPGSSFTPVITIGKQIAEVVCWHDRCDKHAAKQRSLKLLTAMGLDGERVFNAYPQQLSGGMLQRAAIAMALACRPSLLIADEPTTALDSLTQTAVLDLLASLQREHDLSVLLISHDLALVAKYSQRVAVMRRGEIVESGSSQVVLSQPQHSYTQQLLNARASIQVTYQRDSRLLTGEPNA